MAEETETTTRPATALQALREARRLLLRAPERAEKIAKALSAILKAQAELADCRTRARVEKPPQETNIDARRADLIAEHAADVARARAEGFDAGRGSGGGGGALLGSARPG